MKLDVYFGVICNYYCFGWLILYFFGVLLVLCLLFICDCEIKLFFENIGKILYFFYLILLCLSDFGYINSV